MGKWKLDGFRNGQKETNEPKLPMNVVISPTLAPLLLDPAGHEDRKPFSARGGAIPSTSAGAANDITSGRLTRGLVIATLACGVWLGGATALSAPAHTISWRGRCFCDSPLHWEYRAGGAPLAARFVAETWVASWRLRYKGGRRGISNADAIWAKSIFFWSRPYFRGTKAVPRPLHPARE